MAQINVMGVNNSGQIFASACSGSATIYYWSSPTATGVPLVASDYRSSQANGMNAG